jgi:hypothetical protein
MGRKIVFLALLAPLLYSQAIITGGSSSSGGGGGSGSSGTPQCVQTNSVTVTGTTTETTLTGTCGGTGSFTLPANFFSGIGSILRIHIQFNYTPTANVIVIKTKLGGTQINASAFTPANTDSQNCTWDIIMTARTVGVSGTIMSNGAATCFDTTTSTAGQGIGFNILSTAVTINTTGTLVFDFTVTPGAIGQSWKSTDLVLTNY